MNNTQLPDPFRYVVLAVVVIGFAVYVLVMA